MITVFLHLAAAFLSFPWFATLVAYVYARPFSFLPLLLALLTAIGLFIYALRRRTWGSALVFSVGTLVFWLYALLRNLWPYVQSHFA